MAKCVICTRDMAASGLNDGICAGCWMAPGRIVDRIKRMEEKFEFLRRVKDFKLASLPQDGSRGQANAWDVLRAEVIEKERYKAFFWGCAGFPYDGKSRVDRDHHEHGASIRACIENFTSVRSKADSNTERLQAIYALASPDGWDGIVLDYNPVTQKCVVRNANDWACIGQGETFDEAIDDAVKER